jgi:hypothetical protein
VIQPVSSGAYICHKGEISEAQETFRFPYAIYHRKTAIPKTGNIDSEAGNNREWQKLQIPTGRRVYSQIAGMPVISSVSPNHQNL